MIARLNKSFSRRIGKSLSPSQQSLLQNVLPQYLFDPLVTLAAISTKAEIGIGMGDHFVIRAQENPDAIYIGFEPYLNGVANSLKLMQQQNVQNILLWPDDVDLVFDQLPEHCLDELHILFPDPWTKTYHHKRRIINDTRMKLFASKIKVGGMLYFASDIEHYFDEAERVILNNSMFSVKTSDTPYSSYRKTKYHHKADIAGRLSKFLEAKRC